MDNCSTPTAHLLARAQGIAPVLGLNLAVAQRDLCERQILSHPGS